MARYAKPRKRSTGQGLQPTSGPDSFSPSQTQKMGERVRRVLILTDSEASAKEMFLLWQVRLVCLFRQAFKKGQSDETSRLFRAIDRGKKAGHRLGFSEEELISLNRWVTGQDGEQLVEFLLRVEGKLAEVKKN